MHKINAQGHLEVDGGHAVYWETAGRLDGIPALVLHGGPGSGCRSGHYDLFDLDRFQVVLMDQRGCGRSKPLAARTMKGLAQNTTDHLISDICALRAALGFDKWLVFGGSWGSTLGMLYALEHPSHVHALVLAGVATTADRDLAWLYGDVGNMFPEAYDAFCAPVPQAKTMPARIAAYADLLRDQKTAQDAADAWCAWELAIFQQTFEGAGAPWTDPLHRLGFARIVTHYFQHRAWRPNAHILENIGKISDLPTVMIHSRFDPSCPLRAPWDLAQVWPAARLKILEHNDHSALSDRMKIEIRAATDEFARMFA